MSRKVEKHTLFHGFREEDSDQTLYFFCLIMTSSSLTLPPLCFWNGLFRISVWTYTLRQTGVSVQNGKQHRSWLDVPNAQADLGLRCNTGPFSCCGPKLHTALYGLFVLVFTRIRLLDHQWYLINKIVLHIDSCMYTERKKKRRVNFIPKFHSSLKKFVKYFTMITKRYMYGTKVPNFIGLWSTSLELLKFIGSYTPPPPPTPHKSWNQNQTENQYRVCPALAAVAALILLWIELTKALTVRIGMLFHSSINAFLSCARVAGGFRRFLTLLSRSSHMCSIGVKSGLYGGHASGAMLLFAILGQHVVGHCPAVESDYVVAQAGLQQDARSHPYTLLRSYCPQQ